MTKSVAATLTATGAAERPRYQICLVHPFDPRGRKVGGLETYIRDFITFHPSDVDLLFIGIDSQGDLELGRIHDITFRGRRFEFLPILRYSDAQAREAARTIRGSLTGQFFMALLRHFPTIAPILRARRCSIDLRRVEFAWLPTILRLPFIQMLHGEGAPRQEMDSLLGKYRFIHNTGERFAMATSEKFLCVNPFITERMKSTYPSRRHKIDTLWTWVNTDFFQPQQPQPGEALRVVFSGRLDGFKVPSLMFRIVARLRQLLDGKVEFHYVGTSDPERFPEYGLIRDVTIRHGFSDAAGMARILAGADAGILTSRFEGMPRFVLETLAVGRPVVAVHLPQLESVIRDGESGFLVPRVDDEDMVEPLARRLIEARDAVRDGRMAPVSIASAISEFTHHAQLSRVYRYHREIHDSRMLGLDREAA